MSLYMNDLSTLDAADLSERRACGCYFDAPCDCDRGYYEAEYEQDDFYDRYDDCGPEDCEGDAEACPYGGCSDCDDVYGDDGVAEDAAMESSLFGDC